VTIISVNLEQAIFEDSGDYIVKTASTIKEASYWKLALNT
jgi:hypothetical protein